MKNILQKGTRRTNIQPGSHVAIVQKHHQSTGQLTYGVVLNILTASPNHPRGIKVRLESMLVGRVQQVGNEPFANAPIEEAEQEKHVPERTLADFLEFPSSSLSEREEIENPTGTWNCKVCTYSNGVYSTSCEMCETPGEG